MRVISNTRCTATRAAHEHEPALEFQQQAAEEQDRPQA